MIELLDFQEGRLAVAPEELAIRLQESVPWPEGERIELDVSGDFAVIDRSAQKVVDTSAGDV